MTIRAATPEDADTFAQIGAAAFGDADANGGRQRVAEGMREPRHRYYLADLDGASIGTIRLSGYDDAAHITSFAVLPKVQGRGLGRAILTHATRRLSAEGWRSILIEVATENRAALGLYRTCGFREIAAYTYHELSIAPNHESSPGRRGE